MRKTILIFVFMIFLSLTGCDSNQPKFYSVDQVDGYHYALNLYGEFREVSASQDGCMINKGEANYYFIDNNTIIWVSDREDGLVGLTFNGYRSIEEICMPINLYQKFLEEEQNTKGYEYVGEYMYEKRIDDYEIVIHTNENGYAESILYNNFSNNMESYEMFDISEDFDGVTTLEYETFSVIEYVLNNLEINSIGSDSSKAFILSDWLIYLDYETSEYRYQKDNYSFHGLCRNSSCDFVDNHTNEVLNFESLLLDVSPSDIVMFETLIEISNEYFEIIDEFEDSIS